MQKFCVLGKTRWNNEKKVGLSFGNIHFVAETEVGRNSVVYIATWYGLDGPEIESRWGEIFRTSPDRLWPPPSVLYKGSGSFQEVKRPGRGVDHPPPFSAKVKERVRLCLYSPFGPLWPVLGWTLPFIWDRTRVTVVHSIPLLSVKLFVEIILSVAQWPWGRLL
jgi:hypothetical protein